MTRKKLRNQSLKPSIRAFRTLLIVLTLTLTCLLNSRPVLGDYVSDGESMINKGSKIDPATLKLPGVTKPPTEAEPPTVSPANPRNLEVPAKVEKTLTGPAPTEAQKPCEGGEFDHITNAEFISTVFQQIPDGASPAVCTISGDPKVQNGWNAVQAAQGMGQLSSNKNNYLNCSSFRVGGDGSFNVQKNQFAALHFLLLDDDFPY